MFHCCLHYLPFSSLLPYTWIYLCSVAHTAPSVLMLLSEPIWPHLKTTFVFTQGSKMETMCYAQVWNCLYVCLQISVPVNKRLRVLTVSEREYIL